MWRAALLLLYRQEFERVWVNDKRPAGDSSLTMQDLVEDCSHAEVGAQAARSCLLPGFKLLG